ncbi:hypothetical protein [Paenibacillus sp. DCT19]|uniref:hypothetical protein n=1 Tax=Paenibacillus sp. DCT19 TaxID=2211212 RepID=UPI000FE204FD|nr:hypothetical protein [Paenibacillus sp. DCT19]
MTIDSEEAYLTEGKMTLPTGTSYIISASLEKENHFYHLNFTRQRELNDTDRKFFTQLAQSMRILNDQPAVVETESTSGSTKVIKSEDGKTSIRIPSDWESDFRIIIDAKLEATSLSGEEYFISLQSPKSWSDPGTTLEEYVDDYIERQTEFSDDVTKPIKWLSKLMEDQASSLRYFLRWTTSTTSTCTPSLIIQITLRSLVSRLQKIFLWNLSKHT